MLITSKNWPLSGYYVTVSQSGYDPGHERISENVRSTGREVHRPDLRPDSRPGQLSNRRMALRPSSLLGRKCTFAHALAPAIVLVVCQVVKLRGLQRLFSVGYVCLYFLLFNNLSTSRVWYLPLAENNLRVFEAALLYVKLLGQAYLGVLQGFCMGDSTV